MNKRQKIAKEIVSIYRQMDTRDAIKWLEQLRKEIDFGISVLKDDLKVANIDYGGV